MILDFVDIAFLRNVLSSLFLGCCIGFERQWRRRRAGLRTNALVAVGATLFVMAIDAAKPGDDRMRIAAQVVSGIGFLGAGVILREGTSIHGINTAATLWTSAAVGVLCGYGMNARAAIGTSIILVANIGLRPIAARINREPLNLVREYHYAIEIECLEADEERIRYKLLQSVAVGPLALKKLQSATTQGQQKMRVTATIDSSEKSDALVEQIVERLSIEPGVNLASWILLSQEEVAADE